ncbi:MAG: leucine-rich repeat domain-containing protein [Cytophagales bacterium]|nr:leucine-rich repeat domain-containing protein [Cytophagales bacterium]
MRTFKILTLVFCFVSTGLVTNAQKIKSEKVSTTFLKYPKVQVNSLQGLTFRAAKSGDFVVGEAVMKETKSTCVPKGGGLKDVVEVPTYYYEIPVKTPSAIVSVKNAEGEVIFAEEVLKAEDDHSLYGYDQCNNWWKPSLEKKWAEEGQEHMKNGNKFKIENAIEEAKSKIKSDLFYELVPSDFEVNWFKKKDYDYSELEEAAKIAVSGYELFNESYNSEKARAKLGEAVTLWSKAIEELNQEDKDARINKKVGKSIYYDMARALMYMEKFDEAAEAIKAARDLTSSNISNNTTIAQEELYRKIMERKINVEEFAGKAVVYAPENFHIELLDDSQYALLKADLKDHNYNEKSSEFATEMAIYMEEKKKLDEAIAKGEVNPYEHQMTKTTTQGYMLMLYNKDEFPIEITQLTQLNQLFISNGKITSIPREIAALENLKKLNLANNQLTSLPAEIGELKNLKTLNVKGNNIPQSDIDAIQAKLPKCKIKI